MVIQGHIITNVKMVLSDESSSSSNSDSLGEDVPKVEKKD